MAAQLAQARALASMSALEEGMVPRPRLLRRATVARSVAVAALAAVAACQFGGQETFTGLTAGGRYDRPAGHYVVMDKLPKNLVCREAYDIEKYGEKGERKTWFPKTQWRGEASYQAPRTLQADSLRQWYHFDAEGKTLGHLAQAIATTLRGKDSPLYHPASDVGAFVVVTNCEKVRVAWKKYHFKLYFRCFNQRISSVKVERFKDLQRRFPERIIMKSVWGSMPKTPGNRRIFKERLKLFAGPNHNYYHMDPVEYPMHMIKDCTATQNLKSKQRAVDHITKYEPLKRRIQTARIERLEGRRVRSYQNFLKQARAIAHRRGETIDDLSKQELEDLAIERRMSARLKNHGEGGLPKQKTKYYVGSNIEKKKIMRSN
eukprot:TRINITY_DN5758_c0_g1_i3.p1 TRINITY_DN5758_c0_g1~~TRINITY_DN5758_c0_g1_i3.p1  ORF type:complete len:375 (+),score=101.13 TRINITY_DN5758_c0_g1_i3:56-1180(+)